MNYTGQIQDGQMHGQGTLVYPNGERYEGQWNFGKRHGFGTYYYADGGRYEGEWVDDKIHGKGKSVYANGNVYEGEVCGYSELTFNSNCRGHIRFLNGLQWDNGRIDGYGTLTYADGDR